MCKKSLLLISILISVGVNVFAQFTDTTQHHISYTSTGSINKANTGSSYLLNNGLVYEIKKKSIVLNSTNTWIYGQSNHNLTNNDYSSFLNFNLYKTFPHFYYWGLANYNTSFSLKINNQLLAGIGVAYDFVNTKNTYLNLSDGILYDKSDLYLADNTRDIYHTYRNSFRLQFRFIIKDLITVTSSDFLQNSFKRSDDYIIRTNVGVSLKVNKWLNFTTNLNYNRMNRTQTENLLFTYGLTLERYFWQL